MAVDYLKTYLGIDPNDYSAMESRIRGEEPQAQAPIMMRQPMMMPQQRSLGDISAMPMMPRQQPVQQNDSKYDGLMAEIASLKAQIEGMQAPTEQVATEQAPVMAEQAPVMVPTPAVMSEPYQAPPEIQNRMVGEPEPIAQREQVMPQAPSQDIQASIDMLASLPKMNIPQIPDMEEIKRKMAEANMSFPEPVSYQDQLQSIRDIPQPNLPNNFMGNSARNVMSQIQQPQMQSVGRPSTRLAGGFIPEMRAGGGGIDKAIYDLKFKLNG
jgi:hypothetical protein